MREFWIMRAAWRSANTLACLVVLFITACAPTAPRNVAPTAQVQIKQREFEIIIIKDAQTHYFDNRHPHCLAYKVAGEWEFAIQKAALRTPDRRHFVGVLLQEGTVSQAVAYFQADAAKDWGRQVPSTVEPFPSSRAGAMLLQFGEVVITPEAVARALGPDKPKVGQTAQIYKRVLVPFLPGVIMIITTQNVDDARHVLDTLEVTEHPRCWESAIRERFPGVVR